MKLSFFVGVLVIFKLLIACDEEKDNSYRFPTFDHDQTEFSDRDLLNAMYTNYYMPPGFYEERNEGSRYYENTVSIEQNCGDPDSSVWVELCTNSLDQATAWSETSAVHSSYYRTLVSQSETEKFFEFTRVWLEHPNDVLLSRVHKCTYLDRSMYNRAYPGDVIGVFNVRPITLGGIHELCEYLWLNSYLPASKVLSSFTEDLGDQFQHTIYEIWFGGADWGICEGIALKKRLFVVKKDSGEIRMSVEAIRGIQGECPLGGG